MARSTKPGTKNTWTFRSRFRAGAYSWKSSRLACQRIREAVSEIKAGARRDAITAADGAVTLCERFWPALQYVDSSSGALGTTVYKAQAEIIPLIRDAPADGETRGRWLERLWQAIQDDGVQYLWLVEEHWGELCGSPEVASQWADRFVPQVRRSWTHPNSGFLVGRCLCLSSLLAAGRHKELWQLLELERHPFWHYRKFGVQALVKEGNIDEALAYAEASRGLNQPQSEIDAACEQILLDTGRSDEAYTRYALTANEASTGLATFRAIAKKHPQQEPRQILSDLARAGGDPGRWFAAAKEAGLLDLALLFARQGHTDPRTLSRAARDFITRDPDFAREVGRLALERMLQGEGYETTDSDVLEAVRHLQAAVTALQGEEQARSEIVALAAHPLARVRAFRELLRRQALAIMPATESPVENQTVPPPGRTSTQNETQEPQRNRDHPTKGSGSLRLI